jgi:addiction module HigA family antidote
MPDKLPPIHPGAIIAESLGDLGISQKELAEIMGMSPQYICDIVRGRKGLTTEFSIKLAEVLGSTPEMWMRLQNRYDFKVAEGNKAIQRERKAVSKRFHARTRIEKTRKKYAKSPSRESMSARERA